MKLNLSLKKRKNRWQITDKMFYSLFLTGAIIEFSQVGAVFIDGLIISRFMGPVAMAAEGIAYPIFSIIGIFSGLLVSGMQDRCSQAIGRGNQKEFVRLASVTFFISIIVAFTLSGILIGCPKTIAVMLGASGNATDLVEPASQYLFGVGIGMVPVILIAVLSPIIQMDSGARYVQIGALVGAALNVLLDLVAVKLELGLLGIGLATSVSTFANFFVLCSFFLRKDRLTHFIKPKTKFKELIEMLLDGSELAIKRLSNTIRPIVLNTIIISYGGVMAMSVLSIRNNFSGFVEIFGAGIASSVALLTGVFFGEINEEGIQEVFSFKHKTIRNVSGTICVLLFVFAKQIAGFYIKEDSETLAMATFAIRMLALQNPLQAIISSRIKYLQAIQKKLNMNLLILGTKLGFILISAFVLGNLFGIYGILACFTASDALTLIAIYVLYSIKSRKVVPSKEDLLNLPDEFYINPGDVISLDVRDFEDVSLSAEQITLFCKGHKIDERTANFAALAFEELAEDIIERGFPGNKSSNPMIDLRVVITDNTFVIRMRDNCPEYDVTKKMAQVNQDDSDPTSDMGIRIVSKIASDITYLHTFETNNIIIKFKLN